MSTPGGGQPGEMAASLYERDAVVIGKVGGGAHPVRPGGDEKKPAVRLLLGERLLGEDFRRYHPLGEVVSTDKVDSVGNRKTTRDEL